MRIVAVADTHQFHDELVIPDGDVFIHAGDMCRGGDLEEMAVAASWIRSLPHRHKVVIAGNHDWCFVYSPNEARALLGDDVIYLEDALAVIDGMRLWGSPWQPAYNSWAFNLPRGAPLAEKWALIPADIDVLVTHGPPEGHGDGVNMDSSVGGRQGCADLLERVELVKPRVHLFGHIHQDGGVTKNAATTFVNCTTWECERGPTVVDVDASGVRPVQVPSREGGRQS